MITVYVTKWALTTGIVEYQAEETTIDGTRYFSVPGLGRRVSQLFRCTEAFTTIEEARTAVGKLRDAKIKALERQLLKLVTMDVSKLEPKK